jgi:hypothetical protein
LPAHRPVNDARVPLRRSAGIRAVLLFAYVLVLLLPPSSRFAACLLPAIVGEGLGRHGLRRWPRAAALIGGLLACGYVAVVALAVSLCGLGDEVSRACERTEAAAGTLAWCFGTAAVVLTAAACAFPRFRALRYALWATPAAMAVTLVGIATL